MTVTKQLARDTKYEINTGTIGSPTWVEIKGVSGGTHSPSKNDADTTTFDEDGRMSHLPASRGDSFSIDAKYLADSSNGDRDPGQEACEVLAQNVGPVGLGQFRITSPDGYITWTFLASATVTVGGGGNDDPYAWKLDLMVSGTITNSATTAAPGTPTSPSGTALTGGILATWTDGSGTATSYEVVVYLSGNEVARVGSDSKPIAVTGLATSAHTFKVRAHNLAGWSALSSASSNVTPT